MGSKQERVRLPGLGAALERHLVFLQVVVGRQLVLSEVNKPKRVSQRPRSGRVHLLLQCSACAGQAMAVQA